MSMHLMLSTRCHCTHVLHQCVQAGRCPPVSLMALLDQLAAPRHPRTFGLATVCYSVLLGAPIALQVCYCSTPRSFHS